ncbi:MAG TPA: TIGR03118 family protein [Terriglobia bacterium]|nr:TIGR03118 family protein [Terriglobia bacterium]
MTVQRFLGKAAFVFSLIMAACFLPSFVSEAAAQYKVARLVSNQPGAQVQDPNLVNPWGIAFDPSGPFWVSDNGSGLSTLYTGTGAIQGLVVTVPPATGTGAGTPTGIVENTTTDFVVTQNGKSGAANFIFATLDGTISGWAPSVNFSTAVVAVDNSGTGASYTGLAIGVSNGANFIYAADNANNKVDIYDGTFNFVSSFTDPNVPPTFSVFNVQNLNGQLYVTYAGNNNAVGGFVDIFDTAGNFVRTFTSGGTLNQPWGLAIAPPSFGSLGNSVLVGNNTSNGQIGAFSRSSGKLLGQLKTSNGQVIQINQLWAIAFGAGNSQNGGQNTLFFTAGSGNYANGTFGAISAIK